MSGIYIPKSFNHQKISNLLTLDNISCVEYRQHNAQIQKRFFVRHYLFAVVLNGKKIIHTKSGDLNIEAGKAFFAQKGAYMFSEILSSENSYNSLIFLFDDQFLYDFFTANSHLTQKKIDPAISTSIFQITITPLLKSSIESILPYFLHSSSQTQKLLKLKFCEILLHIAELDKDGNFLHFLSNLYSDRKKSLISFMEENYVNPIRIEEFAILSGRSLTAFKKEFNQVFNQTPKQWINQKRLERAHLLLTTTDKNVTQVCYDVGFANSSYFTQLFKKYFSITPKQLQKAQNQQK